MRIRRRRLIYISLLVVALIVAVIVGRDGPSVSVGVGIFALTTAALALVAQPAPPNGGRPEALTNVPPSVPPSPWDNTNIQLRFSAAWARSATFFRCGPQFLWSKRNWS